MFVPNKALCQAYFKFRRGKIFPPQTGAPLLGDARGDGAPEGPARPLFIAYVLSSMNETLALTRYLLIRPSFTVASKFLM